MALRLMPVKIPLSEDLADDADTLAQLAARHCNGLALREIAALAARLHSYADELRAMEGLLRPVIEAPVVVAFPARRHGSDWTQEYGQ